MKKEKKIVTPINTPRGIPKGHKASKKVLTSNKILDKKVKIVPKKIVKKIKKERISTGISGFDKMIEGGFVNGSINLLSGETGTGKSIFAVEYALDGLKKGESVLYVTFEEKKEDFYENMKKIGWDLEKHEKTGKFIFLEYSPEKVRMMLDEGGGSIEAIVLKENITRLVMDSVTSFSLLFDDDHERRAAISGIFDIIGKWNCTTLLTVQSDSTKRSVKNKSLRAEVDGIILLYLDLVKDERKRFIEVVKMRRTKHSSKRHLFSVEKNGIKVK